MSAHPTGSNAAPANSRSDARPHIYLAGPEVFLPEARALGEAKARLCTKAGFVGLFPLDAALDLEGLPQAEQARRIYRADVDLMQRCAAMIGNLTPFRGVSMDSGTAFEAGYMRAIGKPVLGYTNTTDDYRARADLYRAHVRALATAGTIRPWPDADRPDMTVEDFGLTENLMIECAVRDSGFEIVRRSVLSGTEMTDLAGFEACLEMYANSLARPLAGAAG